MFAMRLPLSYLYVRVRGGKWGVVWLGGWGGGRRHGHCHLGFVCSSEGGIARLGNVLRGEMCPVFVDFEPRRALDEHIKLDDLA